MIPATFCLLALNGFLTPAVQAGEARGDPPPEAFSKVVIVSVDGLRSDALILGGPERLPAFLSLLRSSATLNARTDTDRTVTLPNHAGMLTGRPCMGPAGHQWAENEMPAPWETLHDRTGATYLPGLFDVAHDHGLQTALLASKEKFVLFDQTWDAQHGAPDKTGADDGPDKLDLYLFESDNAALTTAALLWLRDTPGRGLLFLHYSLPDDAGHAFGWDLRPGSFYLQAVGVVDRQLGRLVEGLETLPGAAGRSALILTADHGGGSPFTHHSQPEIAANYTIPFLVWLGPRTPPSDLYQLNAGTRQNPGAAQAAGGNPGHPPVYNRDAANLALALLGLPPVPGSAVDREPVLNVLGPLR